MDNNEAKQFNDKMKALYAPETSELIQRNNAYAAQAKNEIKQYERWRSIVYESMDDVKTWERLDNELKEKNELIEQDRAIVNTLNKDLERLKPKLEDCTTKNNEIQIISRDCFKMCNDAQRINNKQNDLKSLQSRIYTTIDTGGRDLRTVEEELQSKSENKDQCMAKRERMNKELMMLNQRVLHAQKELKDKEEIYRDKEAKFEKDQEMNKRKAELNDMLEDYYVEEKNVSVIANFINSNLCFF